MVAPALRCPYHSRREAVVEGDDVSVCARVHVYEYTCIERLNMRHAVADQTVPCTQLNYWDKPYAEFEGYIIRVLLYHPGLHDCHCYQSQAVASTPPLLPPLRQHEPSL